MTEPLSLTAYAKRRGISVVAVSKAVAAGRLSACIVRDDRGAPKIGDVELADAEWTANTRPRIDHPLEEPAADEQPKEPKAELAKSLEVPDYSVSRALREAAAARRESALADIAELDALERKGELVSADEARSEVIDRYTLVKTRLLGVPSRVAQRLPELATTIVPVIDECLREALEELAVDGDAE